jgi:pimeloyl-ACP methyl ester carboxylesterase
MTSRGRRLAVLAAVVAVAVVAAAWRPAQGVAAHAIVDAPNAGKPVPGPQAGELRVESPTPGRAGAAAASIAYEVAGPADARATVLVLHGIRDSREAMRGWGAVLAAAGLRAVLVDLRGQGRSTGDTLTYGVFDAGDLSRVVDDLAAHGVAPGRVGALGLSYGAATSIEWAGGDARVERVVAIAPFASLAEVVPGYTPVPLPDVFVGGAIALAGTMGGFDPAAASPLLAIARTRAPVLLVHGTADDRIPPRHSQELHAAAPDHSEVLLVDGATHETIGDDASGELRRRAVGWLAPLLAP